MSTISTNTSESGEDSFVRLRREVRFLFGDEQRQDGGFIEDTLSGERFPVSVWQIAIAEKLNGQHSWKALRSVIESSGRLEISKVDQFFEWLCDNHLLEPAEKPSKSRTNHRKRRRVSAADKRRKKPKSPIAEKPVDDESWLFGQTPQFMVGFAMVVLMSVFLWHSLVPLEAGVSRTTENEEMLPGIVVKSTCDGVLTDVLVSAGDAVRKGDIIARIENPDDLNRAENLRREIGECRIRRDRLSKDDRDAWRTEVMKLASLTRELGQHQAVMDMIELKAPATGVVVTADSCSRLGSLIEQGDVLMSVVSDLPEDPSVLAGR